MQTDLSQKNENLNAKFNREKGEVKRLKDIVSQKNDEIRESGERIKKLKEIVDEKEKLLFKARVLVKELESELKKIPGLTNKIEELQKEKVRLEEEKKKSVEVLEETTKELDEQNRLVEELESERKKIPGLTKEVEELQKEKVRLEEEKGQLGEVLEETKKELDEQKELVEQLQSEQKSKQEQIKGLKRQVAELIGQLKTGEDTVKELQEEKKTTNAMNVNSLRKFNDRNNVLTEEIDNLRQKLQGVEDALTTANKTIARLKNANKAPQREEPEPQQKREKVSNGDSASMSRISVKSNSRSLKLGLLKVYRSANSLLDFQSLKDFLTDQNIKLKESFPEFEGKHFCHTAVEEVEKCLSKENGGKFEIKKLFTLLQENLEKLAREIIGNRVIEVVNAQDKKNNNIYYDSGRAINAALLNVTENYEVLKTELLSSIKKCIGELKFNEKDPCEMRDSALCKFNERKAGNSDLGALLKGIVVEELVNARMTHFSSKVQEFASSITSKFLSPDQKNVKIYQEK